MIQKVQLLQRRLIGKTEEVMEKDLAIQEREKLYVELKAILARQPGPEAAEQLSYYQVNCDSRILYHCIASRSLPLIPPPPPPPQGLSHLLQSGIRSWMWS